MMRKYDSGLRENSVCRGAIWLPSLKSDEGARACGHLRFGGAQINAGSAVNKPPGNALATTRADIIGARSMRNPTSRHDAYPALPGEIRFCLLLIALILSLFPDKSKVSCWVIYCVYSVCLNMQSLTVSTLVLRCWI